MTAAPTCCARGRKLIETTADATDEEIRTYIKNEIDRASLVPHSGIRIRVKRKVVDLEDPVFNIEERRDLLAIAGVKEVQDRLMYVDPASGRIFPAGFWKRQPAFDLHQGI